MIVTTKIGNEIFKVESIVMGWNHNITTCFYWDINLMLISESDTFPDSMLTRKATYQDISRFETYYRNKQRVI